MEGTLLRSTQIELVKKCSNSNADELQPTINFNKIQIKKICFLFLENELKEIKCRNNVEKKKNCDVFLSIWFSSYLVKSTPVGCYRNHFDKYRLDNADRLGGTISRLLVGWLFFIRKLTWRRTPGLYNAVTPSSLNQRSARPALERNTFSNFISLTYSQLNLTRRFHLNKFSACFISSNVFISW